MHRLAPHYRSCRSFRLGCSPVQIIDATKSHYSGFGHRALRHHTLGIFEAEARFGVDIVNSDGRRVPVRFIGEQHVKEDCGGRIPSVQDWLGRIEPARWMAAGQMDDGPGELAPPDRDRWRAAVAAGETILGLADWLAYCRQVQDPVQDVTDRGAIAIRPR